MERDAGLRVLRLSSRAGRNEVERAYKQECRPLKLRLLHANRPEEIALLRQSIRTLVSACEAVTGNPHLPAPKPSVSGRKVLDLLQRTSVAKLDAARARAFFRLREQPDADAVRAAYRDYARALVRRFANAEDRDEIRTLRRARQKLRTIRNFALA